MQDRPRPAGAAILTGQRLWRIMLYGVMMAAGTLGANAWGLAQVGRDYAVTLAFTAFVPCQFFNVFNARAEHRSAFNRQFVANGRLWLALAGVIGLQIVAVHWGPAQDIFDTVDLAPDDWLRALSIASSVLLLEEARKRILAGTRRLRRVPRMGRRNLGQTRMTLGERVGTMHRRGPDRWISSIRRISCREDAL